MFDPNQFLNTTITGANATKVIPVPEGEYVAQITHPPTFREVTSDKFDGGSAVFCELVWSPQDLDGSIKAATGRDGVTVRQSIRLDLTPQGSLDMSDKANIGLGRLREALGQNDPSRPWGFSMLVGPAARILVSHRTNGEDVYAEVKRVTAL